MWDRTRSYTRIKLCLFDSLDSAYEASFIGADTLGFHIFRWDNVAEKKTRFARMLSYLPFHIGRTLLTDLEHDRLVEVLATVPLDSVQLYPDWSPDDIHALRSAVGRPIRILKVMSARSGENSIKDDRAFLARYEGCADAILLDSCLLGGSGDVADWDHCADIVKVSALPVFLAGGLNAANVGEAVRRVQPFGVDVESGVSDKHPDGLLTKNLTKCRLFVDAVLRADREHARGTAQV